MPTITLKQPTKHKLIIFFKKLKIFGCETASEWDKYMREVNLMPMFVLKQPTKHKRKIFNNFSKMGVKNGGKISV